MKKIILLLTVLLFFSCSKSDNPFVAPTDQLPPATTTGTNKVGCLVNGQVFLPHKNNLFGSSPITCFYQYVNGSFHFSLGFSNDQQENLRGVNIASHNLELQQGNIYPLINNNGNSAFASYVNFTLPDYNTTNLITGELKITKLDQVNAIISGTFWFDAINTNGEIIKIRDGRFDMQYTP